MDKVLEIIKKYLGTPYKHRGRDLQGLDCWGLILLVYADLGIKLWDIEDEYVKDWFQKQRNYFIENYHREWQRVERHEIFDGVLFTNNKGIVNHAGIYIGNNKFLHTCKLGTIVSRLSEKNWQKRLEGFYRFVVSKVEPFNVKANR